MVAWYPLYQRKPCEKDHYSDFFETMVDVFGEHLVHDQVAVAHGSSLKIDFHIGSTVPGHHAVGVEFKMPANNSDVQKALGQLGQYQGRYGESLVVVVFPDLLDSKHLVPFLHDLTRMRIAHVVKKVWNE